MNNSLQLDLFSDPSETPSLDKSDWHARKHIVNVSGGMGSFIAAMRVVEEYGIENTVLLFADTYYEDEDLYRFLFETVAHLHGKTIRCVTPDIPPLDAREERKTYIEGLFRHFSYPSFVRLVDGRDVWEILEEKKILNHMWDKCSQFLKRSLLWKYIKKNYKPHECVIHFGIDWTEEHRLIKLQNFRKPYVCHAPLCEAPYLSKQDMFAISESLGIERPRLYKMGFHHNNCGGFCIKSGQKQFKQLLEKIPERFAFHEAKEKHFQEITGDPHTILRKMTKGDRARYSLTQLREDVEAKRAIDEQDWGGCGCALD